MSIWLGNQRLDGGYSEILNALYPVGSIYIGTQSTCPLTTLIHNSTWELVATDRALWGGNGSNGNTTIAAGLPNITAAASSHNGSLGSLSGALATRTTGRSVGANTGSGFTYDFDFNASRSSSIYGNSTTVQPPAYRVNVWRRTA